MLQKNQNADFLLLQRSRLMDAGKHALAIWTTGRFPVGHSRPQWWNYQGLSRDWSLEFCHMVWGLVSKERAGARLLLAVVSTPALQHSPQLHVNKYVGSPVTSVT